MGLFDGLTNLPDTKCQYCPNEMVYLQTKAFHNRSQRSFDVTKGVLPINEYEEDKDYRPTRTTGTACNSCNQCTSWNEFFFYMDNEGKFLYTIPDVRRSHKLK